MQRRESLLVAQPDIITGGEAVANARDVAFNRPLVEFLSAFAIHAAQSAAIGPLIGKTKRNAADPDAVGPMQRFRNEGVQATVQGDTLRQ